MELTPRLRWRLILGEASQASLCAGMPGGGLGSGGGGGDLEGAPGEGDEEGDGEGGGLGDMDEALEWLYDREEDAEDRSVMRRGPKTGRGRTHPLTVPEWINQIHTLFPKEAIERLESDAFHRYHLHEVVTRMEVLEKAEPSLSLTEAILRCRNQMDPAVLAKAKELVARVVEDMKRLLMEQLESRFGGIPWRNRRSRWKIARNLDAPKTIRRNLQHYQADRQQIVIQTPYFFPRLRRFSSKWQVILLVDESGSMLRNVIHSAVIAACLWGMPAVKTHLCIWDTEVVDLTPHIDDPVEILMQVQLGGGNDAAKALRYAQGLVEAPSRTIVVLITDFYEGAGAAAMVREVKVLLEMGCQVFGIASLDDEVQGAYDRDVALLVADAGAKVVATTPLELVGWLVEQVRR